METPAYLPLVKALNYYHAAHKTAPPRSVYQPRPAKCFAGWCKTRQMTGGLTTAHSLTNASFRKAELCRLKPRSHSARYWHRA
jgi:hypothetical protein